jgi:hypothetical protein
MLWWQVFVIALLVLLVVALAALIMLSQSLGADLQGQEAVRPAYPEGYRSWVHSKSMVVQEGHFLYPQLGGIHHVYANPKALAALTGGKPCPDGSVLVLDVLEARAESRAIVEGARRFVLVMEKDQKRFPRTAGWGYEAFTGDTRERTVKDGGARCHDCHRARRSHDYVLHDWRP